MLHLHSKLLMNILYAHSAQASVYRKPSLEQKWYVVYTKHLSEKKVAERLTSLGVIHYLPVYTTIRQWSDRKKKIEKPLINSVVFVQTNERGLNDLYSVQGIQGVLKYLGRPAIVQEHEIQNLRILLQDLQITGIILQLLLLGIDIEQHIVVSNHDNGFNHVCVVFSL